MAGTKAAALVARAVSNSDLWNAVRKVNPNFAAHTAEGTADLFTERGWTSVTQQGMQTMNEFWNLAMPFFLNIVNISHAKDPLADADVGEYFDTPYGEYVQRMSINSVKPISAAYRDMANGDSPDPFVVRKPTASNRFFPRNFDYASLITMPDEWEQKRIFISEYGMSEFLAGVFEGLENGYVLQKYLNKKEAINAAINGKKGTQSTVNVSLSDEPTEAEMVAYQLQVANTIELMTTSAQTGAFNGEGFASTQDKSRLRLLVRPGYKNRLAMMVARGSYNAETLNLDVDIVVVPDFGGLIPYKEAAFTTRLYPVYDALGEQIGWNETEGKTGASNVTVALGSEFLKDPNENVVAVLADKGFLAEFRQNPYRVEPIRNPRGLYTNYWASSPNNSIVYDPLYNMVVFTNTYTPPTGG